MNTYIVTRGATLILATAAWLLLPDVARGFYNPSTGRWLSRDPVGEKHSRSLYAHLKNNSTASVDLLGLMEVPKCRRIRDKALQDDRVIQRIQVYMKIYKCNSPNPGCACTCSGNIAGYNNSETGQVTLCADNIGNEQELVEVLRHEYVHSLDSCKKKYHPMTGKESACTEIRAAVLSEECCKGGTCRKDDQSFVQCVRDLALAALKAAGWLQAQKYLDEAWTECFLSDM